jgi:hypothetical protein
MADGRSRHGRKRGAVISFPNRTGAWRESGPALAGLGIWGAGCLLVLAAPHRWQEILTLAVTVSAVGSWLLARGAWRALSGRRPPRQHRSRRPGVAGVSAHRVAGAGRLLTLPSPRAQKPEQGGSG